MKRSEPSAMSHTVWNPLPHPFYVSECERALRGLTYVSPSSPEPFPPLPATGKLSTRSELRPQHRPGLVIIISKLHREASAVRTLLPIFSHDPVA